MLCVQGGVAQFLQVLLQDSTEGSMADRWLLSDKHLQRHQATSHLLVDLPAANRNKDVEDALPPRGYRSSKAARNQKTLQLLAAFAAVSVVVLLAYLCSLSIRRRIANLSFVRKLAASADGEESDESASCETDTHGDLRTSEDPRSLPTPSLRVSLSANPAQEKSEAPAPTSPRGNAAAPTEGVWPLQRQQLSTTGYQRSVKRKEKENSSREREAKLIRLEVPIQETPPGPPPSPLDPHVELLIDSVLSESGDPFAEGFWLLDSDTVYAEDSALQSGQAEESVGQQHLPPSTPTEQRSPGLSEHMFTLHESGLTGVAQPSFLDSLLSEATHRTQDALLDEWLLSDEAEAVEETLSLMASSGSPSPSPGNTEEPDEETAGHTPSSAAASEGRLDLGAPSKAKMSESGSPGDVIQKPADSPLRIPPSEPSTDFGHGVATTTLESSVLRGLLSSALDSSAVPTSSGSTGEAALDEGALSAQLLSARAQSAAERLLDTFRQVKEMCLGVPDSILQSHPFYRHPEVNLRLSRKTFDLSKAEWFSTRKQKGLSWLLKCRHLLKKPWLASEEFEELVSVTEHLCGYAYSIFPAELSVHSAVETLGRAFIVLDMLYSAAEALGKCSRKEQWLPMIARRILRVGHIDAAVKQIVRKTAWGSCILNALSVALDYYRVGRRPPVRLVVTLKLSLLLLPVPTDFLNPKWDPWREDARDWAKSTKVTQASG